MGVELTIIVENWYGCKVGSECYIVNDATDEGVLSYGQEIVGLKTCALWYDRLGEALTLLAVVIGVSVEEFDEGSACLNWHHAVAQYVHGVVVLGRVGNPAVGKAVFLDECLDLLEGF